MGLMSATYMIGWDVLGKKKAKKRSGGRLDGDRMAFLVQSA